MFAFFFFNDTATTEIYTLSLHDALPIYDAGERATLGRDAERTGDERLETARRREGQRHAVPTVDEPEHVRPEHRSEEHTSELQSRLHLVCRLLLEKKKQVHTRLLAVVIY